jgi:hypothetical protein
MALFLVTLCGLFWLAFFSPRPPLTIDPATLAGNGKDINYCQLPELDNSGKRATDIAKGNTPGCAYQHFPLPILRECTEPLASGVADLRGLWRAIDGRIGHVERVEQCGSRVVVTTGGIIHDMGPNQTAGSSSNDTEGLIVFSLADRAYCPRTSADIAWQNEVLNFHVFGWGPVVVRRYRDGEHMIWEYVDGSTTRLERICELPAEHAVPQPRGPQLQFF